MGTNQPVAATRAATITGLLVAAAGIGVHAVSGVPMPVVPPALVLLVLGAVLVGLIAKPWSVAVGVLAAVVELAGFVAVGAIGGVLDLDNLGVFFGAWLRLIGCVLAIVAGVRVWRTRTVRSA